MTKKLLIDIGNTSAKLMVVEGETFVHFERRSDSWAATFSRLVQKCGPFDVVRLVSVAGPDPSLDAALSEMNLPVLRLTSQVPCPVKPIQNLPAGYGADRWAADIGALSIDPDNTLLIVDAGTCITYDVFSREGLLLGGVISPGVQLRLKAMHEHTALLPLVAAEAGTETDVLGMNTQTAMLSAAINGTKFEIEGYIRRIQTQYPDLHVFITGGNTFDFSSGITCPITHDPNLVFRGLSVL